MNSPVELRRAALWTPRFACGRDENDDLLTMPVPRAIATGRRLARDAWFRRIGLVPLIEGASLQSGTITDLIFANPSDGTALASSTAETSLMTGFTGSVQPELVAGFFGQSGPTNKSVLLQAMGVMGSTATPTLTMFVRWGTAAASLAGTPIGQSAAMNGANNANAFWFAELLVKRTIPGIGTGAATLVASGYFQSGGVASPFFYSLTPSASATGWTFTQDDSQSQFINVSAQWSANSASNTIQVKQLVVLGLN